MSGSSSLKHEFLKNWIKGLRICRNMKEEEAASSILERKNAIKLSADVAMAASAGSGATQWRRALLDDVVSRNPSKKSMVEEVLGHKLGIENRGRLMMRWCSGRILRRSRIGGRRRKPTRVVPQCGALRKLVPGGEEMDGVSLIPETLDYIVSLRLQVDVMRYLATASCN